MRLPLLVSSCVLASVIGCSTGPVKPVPVAKSTTAPVVNKKPIKKEEAPREDEFQQMRRIFKLEGEQLVKFNEAYAKREAAWAAIEKGADGQAEAAARTQLAEARKAANQPEVDRLTAEVKRLHDSIWARRTALRASVMAELTDPQLQEWAAMRMEGGVMRKIGKAGLTDDQKATVKQLCADASTKSLTREVILSDPFLMGATVSDVVTAIAEKAKADVLTAEQRVKLEPKPTTAPTTTQQSK